MKKFLLIALIVIAALGGGFFYWQSHSAHAEDGGAAAGQGQPQAQPVSVTQIQEQKITIKQTLPGRVSAFRQSQIRPQVDGIITERLFEEGAEVTKGQQLYQIDDARYTASLNSALADLKSAEANVKTVKAREKRYKDLVKVKAVSQQEYDDIKAELDQANASIAVAQAAVDLAQVNLDYTKVYAPIDGRISRSFVTEGALVTANQTEHLATITQLDPVYIDMQQSGSAALKLRQKLMRKNTVPVSLILDEKSGQRYANHGVLKFSEVTVDETTGSITLRAIVPNPDGLLLPGLFVRAELDMGEETALLVPQRATTRKADGTLSVWIVDAEDKAQQRAITTSDAYEDYWIVESGIEAGDKLIVEGYQKVAPDMAVAPEEWTKEQPQNDSAPQKAE
ncbi:MAG: efflux transporter periplasmic adaptor subunit [Micavibrio sp.]|nr:efflux transporter periplasmic adaptor subunit [Micavibrio sp.]HCK32868.1 efflux RND transporter periplasmic adaptor subunit [Rhodospirillaceae bacterium]|tara:strand:- start:107 stop:1291 length:1185 start_codon:yes stop_codon:yes gene_type:complete